MRIVIIEDNPADVALFREALKFSAIRATLWHFPDATLALSTLAANTDPWIPPPDIVFLDLNMPRVSGFEVLAALRGSASCAGVPVVIFTSSQAPADAQRATELGGSRFLRKPTNLREFFDVVRLTIRDLATA